MRKGKILQVGTPQELYLNPQHIFVANFIGESNFLEGYVTKLTEKESIIELRGGIPVRTLDKTHKEGEKVVVAVRPEILTVKRGEEKGANSIFGHVEGFRFEGTNVRYEIRLENEDLVVVVRPALMAEWLDVGEKVTVSFPIEKSFVFAYPERGLKRELTLE
jgi:ABC-type Fe3+/spermidine/putrescine transport system ATPase subunit